MAGDRSMNLGLYCLETFLIWEPASFVHRESGLQHELLDSAVRKKMTARNIVYRHLRGH